MDSAVPSIEPLLQRQLKGGTEIVIAQDIPIALANTVFTSINQHADPGPLNELVLGELGGSDVSFDLEQMNEAGFQAVNISETNVFFVVTVADDKKSDELLQNNLSKAVSESFSFQVEREPLWDTPHSTSGGSEQLFGSGERVNRAIWTPLMATGSGGLSNDASMEITLRVLKAHGDWGPHASFLISLPPKANPKELQQLIDTANRVLDENDPDNDTSDISPDYTRFFHDLPSKEDSLGRKVIAETITRNVLSIWPTYKKRNAPYIVHLSGRWGSGKSSLLYHLRQELNDNNWLVIDYNAWRHQDEKEAWWSLLTGVTRGAIKELGVWGHSLKLSDRLWRFRTNWGGLIGGFWVLLAVLAAVYLFGSFSWFGDPSTSAVEKFTITEPGVERIIGDQTHTVETKTEFTSTLASKSPFFDVVVAIGGIITALFGFVTLFGSYFRRSNNQAEEMARLSVDATNRLSRRFKHVVTNVLQRDTGQEVAVFIDDLDRCDASFVIQLLQAIQNVFSDVPILYVVAADRDWIRSAYEQSYSEFENQVKMPGKTLGDLFVEKIFQVSINLPDLGAQDKDAYLQTLLKNETDDQKKPTRDKGRGIDDLTPDEQMLSSTLLQEAAGNLLTLEKQIQTQDNPAIKLRLAQEGLRIATEPQSTGFVLERLLHHSDLMDPNPRAIKRLANLYSYRYGYGLLMQMPISERSDTLARWCILEDRFPRANRRLIQDPDLLDEIEVKNDTSWGTKIVPKWHLQPDDFPDQDAITEILGPMTQDDIETLRRFG